MHPDIETILFTEEEIAARAKELGTEITERYKDVEPYSIVLVGMMRGTVMLFADLARAIDLPIELDYMAVSSYGLGATSSGVVTIEKDMTSSPEGRHVIIAEDVIETGLTLSHVIDHLKSRGAKSVEVVAMFSKKEKRIAEIENAHIGFECPDEFLVGYGLDYAQHYRNLPYLGALKREVYEK